MFTVDHIQAQANGGGNEMANTIPACQFCNGMKGNHEAENFQAIINYMLRKGIHPHQIFLETGIWMAPIAIDMRKVKRQKT